METGERGDKLCCLWQQMQTAKSKETRNSHRNDLYLEEAEERLKECNVYFLKAHFSYLINPCYIVRLGKTLILLDRGEELPVSRSRGKEVCVHFDSYIRLYREGKMQNRALDLQNRT